MESYKNKARGSLAVYDINGSTSESDAYTATMKSMETQKSIVQPIRINMEGAN